jgi:uncharacterized protein YbcI/anti-sigma regulatory factor (Ser/Thr protein kinase)
MDLQFALQSDPKASAQARLNLMPLATALSAEAFSDLRMIVNELVTNSVQFGPGAQIDVRVEVDPEGRVSGQVADGGVGDISIRDDPDPEVAGLGLLIVQSLASKWGVRPESTTVWFELAERNGQSLVGPELPGRIIQDEIATELLRIHADTYGGTADSVSVLLSEDAVVVFMDGLHLQPSERFLINAGDANVVVETRHRFQQAIETTFRAAVERIIGRRVVSFASVVKLDPDYACEIFRLGPRSTTAE